MIDSDLFQTIALALLFLILLIQLIQLAVINSMKRSMGTQTTISPIEDTTSSAAGYGATSSAYGATPSTYESAGYGASPGYGGATGATYGGYTGTPTTTTPTETHEPATEARPEVTTSYVPVEQATPAVTQEPAPAAAPALTGNEPEEQPFERDGRWWFKRGGELLVYDEGTGQWVAAPGSYTGASATGAAPAAGTTTTETTTASAAPADSGEGWRCASCGAINGSTATVCRMCFTPRA